MTDTARPAPVAAAMARAGEEYDQNDRRQGERRHVAAGDDLLEVTRTLCAIAARRREIPVERRANYPHADEDGAPVLLAAQRACLARGYTEDGMAVDGVRYPVASVSGAEVPRVLTDERIKQLIGPELSKGDGGYIEDMFHAGILAAGRAIEREVLARKTPPESEVQAAEAKLYRDLTGDAMALGYDGIVAALEALRQAPARSSETVPAVVREAVEAAFEDRAGWRTKIAAAVRAIATPTAIEGAAPDLSSLKRYNYAGYVCYESETGEYYRVADVQAAISKTSSAGKGAQ